MVQGTERRTVPADNLRGASHVEPVSRQVPSVSSVPTPNLPDTSFSQRVAQSLQGFASGKLQAIQKKEQEKSVVDGQLAAMQGDSFESVEMDGDKWALEGYRAVTAQTMSAELLRAQQSEIENGAYEQDPDAYRARLVDRINGMTDGIDDERTRTLAREQLMRQMPTLVDAHMTSNLAFREDQNFQALSMSIDSLSRDVGSRDALLSFAQGGDGTATAGLSQARRKEAVTQGIVAAFENNNPSAFAVLEDAGFLNPENLTVAQLRSIDAAKNAFHARMESEWNGEHHAQHTAITDRVTAGDIDPLEAARLIAENNAKHGMRMNAAQGRAIYDAARAGVEFSQGTRGINVAAAGQSGDFGLQASLLTDAVEHHESRGNPNATSPVGARGLMQLMPDTMLDPGFGVGNIFDYADRLGIEHSKDPSNASAEADRLAAIPAVNKAMGTDYLEAMLRRYEGDVPRALAAYNWGAGNADDWDGDMSSLPQETRDYINRIQSTVNDDRPDPQGERVAAENNYNRIRERAALDTYEAMYPALARMDEAFTNDLLDEDAWRDQRRELYAAHGQEVDMQRLQQESRMVRETIQSQISKEVENIDADKLIAMNGAQTALDIQLERDQKTISEGGEVFDDQGNALTPTDVLARYSDASRSLYDEFGIAVDPTAQSNRNESGVRETLRAIELGRAAQEQAAMIARAERNNSVHTLDPDAQSNALKGFRDRVSRNAEQMKAENPDVPPAQVDALVYAQEIEYISKNNIVDEEIQGQLAMAGSGEWLTPDGKPSPMAAIAVQMFAGLEGRNPSLAAQYVPDAQTRGRLMAAASVAYAINPDLAVGLGQVDLSNPNDPNAQAIYAAVDHIGKQTGTTTPEQDAERIAATMKAIDRGNLTNTFMGGALATNAANALVPRGTVQAAMNPQWETADVDTWSDTAAVDNQFRSHVQDFIEETLPYMQGLSNTQASRRAMSYVKTRGAAMGSGFVMPRGDQPSIAVQMFGEQTTNTAAANTAMRQYLASEMMREVNPGLEPSTRFGFERGFDFTVNQVGDQWVAAIVHPDGLLTDAPEDPLGISRFVVIPSLSVVGDFYKESQANPTVPLSDIYRETRPTVQDDLLPQSN